MDDEEATATINPPHMTKTTLVACVCQQPTAVSNLHLWMGENKKAVSWCAHGPADYVKSPVDGRTTPHVHNAAIDAQPRGHARQHSGVVH